jgi:catechol 2,3-dioxygenase-like lactoylglutathione lyase family enzyme
MLVNHLHLHVRDLDRSRAFYEDWFGLREHCFHGPILFLRDEQGFDLALAPDDSPPQCPGWFHFGFRLDDGDAVRELHQRMSDAGVDVQGPLHDHEDLVAFRCLDPDGYSVEIYFE